MTPATHSVFGSQQRRQPLSVFRSALAASAVTEDIKARRCGQFHTASGEMCIPLVSLLLLLLAVLTIRAFRLIAIPLWADSSTTLLVPEK